jgi:NAD(P)-dependent dehydrogenase (short-subunit alcohol dehydrogenase family)
MSGTGAFVVIGAGSGLGAAAARRFGREGHPVGLIARGSERLEAMAAELAAEGLTTATETADVTDAQALAAALGALRERLGPIQAALFSPRPSLAWIKPVLDTGPSDVASALALSVVAAVAAVSAVLPDMCHHGHGTLLFTTGGAVHHGRRRRRAAPRPRGVRNRLRGRVCLRAHAPRHARRPGVHAAQVAVVGPIGPGARHEPDAVAQELWRLHTERDQPLVVLR